MDRRTEIRDFLTSRRARITPEQAGLHSYSRNRRVPGLRHGEVADLAGVSVEYDAQLERGSPTLPSDAAKPSRQRRQPCRPRRLRLMA
jgi:hypothetical protein